MGKPDINLHASSSIRVRRPPIDRYIIDGFSDRGKLFVLAPVLFVAKSFAMIPQLSTGKLDEASTQTVVDLAAHIRGLRVSAVALQQTLETRSRGYFTPDEDDHVLHLWVSYHKSRSALLELIDAVRRSVGQAREERAESFAVAYAAALILVSAARSLRDLFGKNELVRRKLNESHVAYGIEANSFDAIQLSLTDPANALRLREANEFYTAQRQRLQDQASRDAGLCRVLAVIEELAESVRVSTARYLKARVSERRYQANEQVVKGNLLRAIYAIQEWGSRLASSIRTDPRHVSQLPPGIVDQLLGMLQPGDVFVTRKECALTNYFLPGYWPHAALYIGDQQVIESLKDGVRERPLLSPFGNDAVAVIRPQLDTDTILQAITRARTHLGKPYDFDFDFTRADRMVCTEVVYRSYEGLGSIRFQLTRRAGRQTLAAEDLLNLAIGRRFFDQVAVFCPLHSDQILLGDEMTAVLRKTIAAS